jgi:hypothetical protein
VLTTTVSPSFGIEPVPGRKSYWKETKKTVINIDLFIILTSVHDIQIHDIIDFEK